jgi:hypothetical protein
MNTSLSVKVKQTKRWLTMRARGRLDSHRQNGFFVAFGFILFESESHPFQPPVTRAVGLPLNNL